MTTRTVHYFSGLAITVFVGFHLLNHVWAIYGANAHIEMMRTLRLVYRNPVVEVILLGAMLGQIISGFKLFAAARKQSTSGFEKLHVWTGLYLAFFFLIHVGAVLTGRLALDLDTNFYFGVAGLNTLPFSLFFMPYYGLAILAFFGHVAAVHQKKMTKTVLGLSPDRQSLSFLAGGLIVTVVIFYGLTNRFKGVEVPDKYKVLVGR